MPAEEPLTTRIEVPEPFKLFGVRVALTPEGVIVARLTVPEKPPVAVMLTVEVAHDPGSSGPTVAGFAWIEKSAPVVVVAPSVPGMTAAIGTETLCWFVVATEFTGDMSTTATRTTTERVVAEANSREFVLVRPLCSVTEIREARASV